MMTDLFTIDESRRVVYEGYDCQLGSGVFLPKCPNCGRYVQADEIAKLTIGGAAEPNATCSRCGRVTMPFEGFY